MEYEVDPLYVNMRTGQSMQIICNHFRRQLFPLVTWRAELYCRHMFVKLLTDMATVFVIKLLQLSSTQGSKTSTLKIN